MKIAAVDFAKANDFNQNASAKDQEITVWNGAGVNKGRRSL